MKCSYNLSEFNINLKAKDDFQMDMSLGQSKVEIEFNLEEMGSVLSNALEMRKLFIEGVERITPVIKETLIDLGEKFSTEIEKHEDVSYKRSIERMCVERESETLRHQERMAEFEAQKR